MNRTFLDILAIAKELQAVYDAYQRANADNKISVEEGLALAGQVIAVLNKHNVTLVELETLLTEVGPLLALVKA